MIDTHSDDERADANEATDAVEHKEIVDTKGDGRSLAECARVQRLIAQLIVVEVLVNTNNGAHRVDIGWPVLEHVFS